MTTTLTPTRECTRCNRDLPRTAEHFPSNKRMADGMSSWCRQCHRDAVKERNARDPHKSRRRAKEWAAAHPEIARQRVIEWKMANPERYRALGRISYARRSERMLGAAGRATPEQIQARVDYFGGLCWMCGAAWECIDHVIPLARGGSNWPSNLRPACTSCNSSKGAKLPREMEL